MHPSVHRPWAITEGALRDICDRLASAEGSALRAAYRAEQGAPARAPSNAGAVARIDVSGPLESHDSFFSFLFGGTSYSGIAAQLRAAEGDLAIGSILLVIDSPGGDVNGCAELAAEINRCQKPVHSYVTGLGASGAYWLASATRRITCSSTAILGSIGVYQALVDSSKREDAVGVKVKKIVASQSPFKVVDPSDDADVARVQKVVDDLAQVFVSDVARYRGTTVKKVLADYGKGDVMVGQVAVDAGLADAVGSLESTIAGLASGTFAPPRAVATREIAMLKCKSCKSDMNDDSECYCAKCWDGDDDDSDSKSARAAVSFRADLLSATGKVSATEAAGVIAAWKASHDKYGAVVAELSALKSAQASTEFGALIDQGVKDGKITPHQKAESAKSESWLGRMKARPDGADELRAYLSEAAAIVTTSSTAAREVSPDKVPLSQVEIDVAKAMGHSIEDAQRAKAERMKAGAVR